MSGLNLITKRTITPTHSVFWELICLNYAVFHRNDVGSQQHSRLDFASWCNKFLKVRGFVDPLVFRAFPLEFRYKRQNELCTQQGQLSSHPRPTVSHVSPVLNSVSQTHDSLSDIAV